MTREPIDPVAFLIAFVSAPFVFTLMYFWVLFIPVIAFIGGLLPYLILGLPLLMWHLLFHDINEDLLHRFALKSILTIGIPVMVMSVVFKAEALLGFALYGTIFGVMIGPLWAIQFCRIYVALRRPIV
jgi:hypothetical protein